MSRTAIVCDSTCDLGPEFLDEHDVAMVPLKVLFGEDTYLDWTEMRPDRFYRMLREAKRLPTTSQPSPADFAAVYERLAREGAETIVSIHLTSPLSGTYESAHMAAQETDVDVRVIDTGLVSQGLGLAVKAAITARDADSTADEIEHAARRTAEDTRMFFILDTLDYLVKGGRAGRAQGLAASLLSIKPILTFEDGIVAPFKKVSGTSKALATLAEHVGEESRRGPLVLALLHAEAPDRAEHLRAAIEAVGCDCAFDSTGVVGSVIGTYAGPGAVGVAYHTVRTDR